MLTDLLRAVADHAPLIHPVAGLSFAVACAFGVVYLATARRAFVFTGACAALYGVPLALFA